MLVQPDTVVRWHREWLRQRWTRRSARVRPGRPGTDAAIRTLVSQMAAANPLWGAPRIHGELSNVAVAVSERTVSRLLRRPRRPPSQTWRTFLTNHVATLRRVLTAYLTYYHSSRTHLSLEKDAPAPRRVQAIREGDVVAFPAVGRLHHRYERRAA